MFNGLSDELTVNVSRQVSEVLSAIMNLPEEEITKAAYENTLKMFGLKE